MRASACVTLLACSALLGSAALAADAAPCASPEHRQFDFFAGDWDTYDMEAPTKVVARNRVTPMVDGCALREVYEATDGLRGESFSAFDTGRGVWHQSWVTNRGQLLLLDGKLEGPRMVFRATEKTASGEVLWRAVWWPEGASVRETAERSSDGGLTWKPAFDIVFRKHAS